MFKLSSTYGMFFGSVSRYSWDICNFLNLWIICNVKEKDKKRIAEDYINKIDTFGTLTATNDEISVNRCRW